MQHAATPATNDRSINELWDAAGVLGRAVVELQDIAKVQTAPTTAARSVEELWEGAGLLGRTILDLQDLALAQGEKIRGLEARLAEAEAVAAQASARKPRASLSHLPPREGRDSTGRPGKALIGFIRHCYPTVSATNVKEILVREGDLQRVAGKNKIKAAFYTTPLGSRYFFDLPYLNCAGWPETFVRPEGEVEIERLFRAGKLPFRRTNGLRPDGQPDV